MPNTYTIDDVRQLIAAGFSFQLPEKTTQIIAKLAAEVGSPTYVKTPAFPAGAGAAGAAAIAHKKAPPPPSAAVPPPLADVVRMNLNKLSDKNYTAIRDKIIELISGGDVPPEICSLVFEIASTNKFYSKLYAALYAELADVSPLADIFATNFAAFVGLFDVLAGDADAADPNVDYNRFCEYNKASEHRKSLAAFYLASAGAGAGATRPLLTEADILDLVGQLVARIRVALAEDGRKNAVDEMAEVVSILYPRAAFLKRKGAPEIADFICEIAESKTSDYASLSNKTLFKFMDYCD